MAMKKADDDAARWEDLARQEPYFPVLASDGAATGSEAFFQTGEEDVGALLGALSTLLSRGVRLGSVLDFGCGTGRLTLPLARRAGHVVACDVAPTMLVHARENAERAGLHNISFQPFDGVVAGFDFICSLLVFQYIPPAEGQPLLRRLAVLLRPGGVAAVQVPLQTPMNLQRYARFSRRPRTSERAFTQVHAYAERLVVDAVESGGASMVARLDSAGGAVLIFRR